MALIRTKILPLALLALSAGAAQAMDYRSALEHAVLYQQPDAASAVAQLLPGTPVEAVQTNGGWVKVRAPGVNGLLWMDASRLSPQRMVMVKAPRAAARQAMRFDAPIVFEARKDVLLHLTGGVQNGWVAVQHRDGESGYMRITELWGL